MLDKTKRQQKEIKNYLKGKKLGELKKIIIDLLPKDKCNRQEIIKRDNYKCVLCDDKENLCIHHLKPKILRGNQDENNLLTLCNYCHWYLHNNPKFKIHHSDLIKASMIKRNGVTKSFKGNKWGRKELSKDKLIKIKEYYKLNPKATFRDVEKGTGISRSCIHKYFSQK